MCQVLFLRTPDTTAGGMAAVSQRSDGIQPEGNVDAHACPCKVFNQLSSSHPC